MTNNTQHAADWKLVPVEPTGEMMNAGLYQSSRDSTYADVHSIWKDMCAFAPISPDAAHAQPPIGDVPAEQGATGDAEIIERALRLEVHRLADMCSAAAQKGFRLPSGRKVTAEEVKTLFAQSDAARNCLSNFIEGRAAPISEDDGSAPWPDCADKVCHKNGECWTAGKCLNPAASVSAAPIGDVPAEVLTDTERLDWLRNETCDLRCISVPTGGDDSDVRWIIVQHHMSEPREREISRSRTEDPRDAIDRAISSPAPESQGGGK